MRRSGFVFIRREEGDYEAGLDMLGEDQLQLVTYEEPVTNLGWVPLPSLRERLHDATRLGVCRRTDGLNDTEYHASGPGIR